MLPYYIFIQLCLVTLIKCDDDKKLNFDDNLGLMIAVPIVLSVAPVLFPFLHLICYMLYKDVKEKGEVFMRLCSLYAYIGMFLWLTYITIYQTMNIKQFGESITFIVFVFACICAPLSYIYVILESFYSYEYNYLCTTFKNDEAKNHIENCINVKPRVFTSMECYHLDTTSREVWYTDNQGRSGYRTEYTTKKVVTFTGEDEFHFLYWKDMSDTTTIPNCPLDSVIRIELHEQVDFADEATKEAFLQQQKSYVARTKGFDDHFKYSTKMFVDLDKKRFLCKDKESTVMPSWMNQTQFLFWTFLCCTWPYRIVFNLLTDKKEFKVSKIVSNLPIQATQNQHLLSKKTNTNYQSILRIL